MKTAAVLYRQRDNHAPCLAGDDHFFLCFYRHTDGRRIRQGRDILSGHSRCGEEQKQDDDTNMWLHLFFRCRQWSLP